MKIGAAIADIRNKREMFQYQLAMKVDISQSYLSQVETDAVTPSMEVLEKICAALAVPMYFVLFKALETDDVPEGKHDAYRTLAPAVEGLMEGFFLHP